MTTEHSQIQQLVEKYEHLSVDERDAFTEQDVGTKFILPLLDLLGWDTQDINQVREQRRTRSGPSDYELLSNNQIKIVVEIKRFTTSLDGEYHDKRHPDKKESFPEQAIRYAWHLKTDWVILTNFKELRIYHSNCKNPQDGLVLDISVSDMVEKISELMLVSRGKVELGILDTLKVKRGRKTIDEEILDDLTDIRKMLQEEANHGNMDLNSLRNIIQQFMDRLLVIRVSEDRGILGSDMLLKYLNLWQNQGLDSFFANRLRLTFQEFGDVYDTRLFEENELDKITFSNQVLTKTINILYKYNFDLIDSDILGSVYENYLTISLMETEQGDLKIVDDNKDRQKEKGAYYTPRHLIDFILSETLGKKLKECKIPEDVAKIKILDTSCGSGSFLIKAFDLLFEWYTKYNQNLETAHKGNLDGLTGCIVDPERQILRNNLFGTDIDHQAAEIASVNLMLKAMRKGERLEPILGNNIRVGNALVTGVENDFEKLDEDVKRNMRAFDYNKFDNTKFDIIVGNPPYFKVDSNNPIRISEQYTQVQKGQSVNIAMMFIHKSIQLLNENGYLGLVIPKMCSYTNGWSKIRNHIFKNILLTNIIDCKQAFDKVLLEQILLIGRAVNVKEFQDDTYRIGVATQNGISSDASISQKLSVTNDFLFLESNSMAYDIRDKILLKSTMFSDISAFMSLSGEGIQSKHQWDSEKTDDSIKFIGGAQIARYFVDEKDFFSRNSNVAKIYAKKLKTLDKPHIVCQRICAHITTPEPHLILMFGFDDKGSLAANTVTHILSNEDKTKKMTQYALLGILNSKMISYYAYKFIYSNAMRSMDLYIAYLNKIPIPNMSKDKYDEIESLVKDHLEHVKNSTRIKPKIKNYLISPTYAKFSLKEYYKRFDDKDRELIDSNTEGIISKIHTKSENRWITFSVDYQSSKSPITKMTDVLKIRVDDEILLSYLLHSFNNPKLTNKKKRLVDQILDMKTNGYGETYEEHMSELRHMLEGYLISFKKFKKWSDEFIMREKQIDQIVYDSVGLTNEEICLIEKNSRSYEWNNY